MREWCEGWVGELKLLSKNDLKTTIAFKRLQEVRQRCILAQGLQGGSVVYRSDAEGTELRSRIVLLRRPTTLAYGWGKNNAKFDKC